MIAGTLAVPHLDCGARRDNIFSERAPYIISPPSAGRVRDL